ncbi:MAG: class I SAM-dependent methyltransferase [bacterium]
MKPQSNGPNIMIEATDKPWNSATTLYIARKLQSITKGKSLSVLDLGCGDGTVLEYLLGYGYDLCGYDLPECAAALKKRISKYFGASFHKHFRITEDERSIPFEDKLFDVIYANQVFEHISSLGSILQECNRVLKPNGVLLAIFPLATSPIETHIGIPFAHWIPQGNFRVQYLRFFYAMGLRSRSKGISCFETAINQDLYLKEKTFYRFSNEIRKLSMPYFQSFKCETDLLVRAKLDLMKIDKNPIKHLSGSFIRLFEGNCLSLLSTYFIDAAFCMSYPKKHQK